jgi:parallel beta-helix repeat protein
MRMVSKIRLSIVVLVLIVAISASSYAADGKIKIGQTPSTIFPIVIDQSGSYVLTSNLQVSTNFNCIQIAANNVTLDLNGFALTGPGTGSGGSGIYVNGYNNITVMNGTVRDFMSSGIYFLSSTKIQLKDLKCANNGQRGIYAEHATVVNCIAEDNGTDGIRAYYSTIKDCTSNNNTDDGLDVLSSTVLNFQAYSNDNRGIYSRRSSLTNCTITFSGGYGIEVSDSTVINSTVYDNDAGIVATNSTVTNCTVNNNSHYGFDLSNSIVTNCTANNNGHYCFYLNGNNRVEGNCCHNNAGGIHASNGHNVVIKNMLYGNTGLTFVHGFDSFMPVGEGDNANNPTY